MSYIQKLCKKEPEFSRTEVSISKNAKACSRDSHSIFDKDDESISLLSKNIVVSKTENFDYTGGLHGDYQSNYLNLDRNSGKMIQMSKGVIVWFGLSEISGYANGEPSFLIPLNKLKSYKL